MPTPKLFSRYLVTAATAMLVLSACATSPVDTQSARAEGQNAEVSAEPTTDAPTTDAESETPLPTATTPEPEPVETSGAGELVQLPSADFTVRTIEERDMIPTDFPDSEPNFEPGQGERLWYFHIEWTNNTLDAVAKECHGPDMFDLRAYDVDGVEMLMVDQPGMIEGQECSSGLRQGETGTWYTAFYGGDAEFGWAAFTDYSDDDAVVTLDPSLELIRTP